MAPLSAPPARPAPARPATEPVPVRRGRALLAVAVPTAVTAVHAALYGRWIVDDAGITFAYARSMATGAGPVLQPGASPVEGYSNPAWLALLVLGRWLGLFDHGTWFGVPDYVAFPKALALLCCAGMFACMYLAAKAVSARPALLTVVAGSLTAAVPAFVIWCVSGLENSLLALAVLGLAAVLVRAAAERRLMRPSIALGCGLLAALAALTRPDGLVYLAALPVVALLAALRTIARGGGTWRGAVRGVVAATGVSVVAFGVPFGGYLVWRVLTFGELLPNTALAKGQGLPGFDALARPVELVGYLGWYLVLVAVLLVAVALAVPSPSRPGLLALCVPLGLALLAFAVLNADWMGQYRFSTPVWPLAALVATVAAGQVIGRLSWSGRSAVGVVLAAAALVSGVGLAGQARAFRAEPTTPLCLVAQNAGRNVAGYAAIVGVPSPTVLVPDIGGSSLAGNVRIVDLAGLADARIAGFWRRGDPAGLRDYVFGVVRPTFIKSHGGWSAMTGLTADFRLAADYSEIGSTVGTTDWVRTDVLTRPDLLDQLRGYFSRVAAPADAEARRAPRASCGPVLRG